MTRILAILLFLIFFVNAEQSARAEGQGNGESCSSNSECSSGYCYPGPGDSGNFCLHKDLNCAWPGGNGERYRSVHNYNGKCYTCTSEGGRAHWKQGGGSFFPGRGVFGGRRC